MINGSGRIAGTMWMAVTMGCASTVSSTAGDAASTSVDSSAVDLGVVGVDAPAIDAPTADASVACPMINDDVPAPDLPPTDVPYVVDLAVGSQLHKCALMSDRTVRCRGWNVAGSLGIGTFGEYNVPPTTVPDLRDVEQVVTINLNVTCSRHGDGSVRCWGSNRFNLLGTGHEGDEDCQGTPCRTRPTLVPGLAEVVHLAVGRFSICAVRRDGSVWCWGSTDGPGGLLPSAGSSVPVVAARATDVAALWSRSYGWVWRLRSGVYGSDGQFRDLAIPPEAEFADGPPSEHLCYRLPDGSTRCLGANHHGKVGNGRSLDDLPGVTEPSNPGLCGVRSVATGTYNTCAVLSDRTVRCWGDGSNNALGSPASERCVGVLSEVECSTRPTPVPGLGGVDRLYLGVWGGCAIRVDRSVWCWGSVSPDRSPIAAPIGW